MAALFSKPFLGSRYASDGSAPLGSLHSPSVLTSQNLQLLARRSLPKRLGLNTKVPNTDKCINRSLEIHGCREPPSRETVRNVAAGAVAKMILEQHAGTEILAYVSQVHKVALPEDLVDNDVVTRDQIENNIVRCPNLDYALKMIAAIDAVRGRGDSLGGTITCVIRNVPRGRRSTDLTKLRGDLTRAVMSLPATTGFDFFRGLSDTSMTDYDGFYLIRPEANRPRGIQGIISNGETIKTKVVFAPTTTIFGRQNTRSGGKHEMRLVTRGHDVPFVLPRAVSVVEAMMALGVVDLLIATIFLMSE